jgi:Flp pilus assembly pilin Flp
MRRLISFAADARGSALIEYSLIAAGLGLGLLIAILSLSDELQAIYSGISAGVASLLSL